LKLAARGSDRAALAASLQGQGLLRAREASFGQFEWTPVAANVAVEPTPDSQGSPFVLTSSFQVSARQIRLDQFLLTRSGEQTEVTGTVDFTRRVDLRVQSLAHLFAPAAVGDSTPQDFWTVAGTLDAPRVTATPASARGNPDGVPSASAQPLTTR
jgi:hypothetical protein